VRVNETLDDISIYAYLASEIRKNRRSLRR